MVRNSSHPRSITHPFDKNHVLSLTSTTDSSCICNACGEVADGLYYSCRNCDIDLHTHCASMPMTLSHRSHHHQLTLVFSVPYPTKCFTCNLCRGMGSGQWLYRCDLCAFDVHMRCAHGPNSMPYNAANISNVMHYAASPARPSMNTAGGGFLGTMFLSSAIGGTFQALGTNFTNLIFGVGGGGHDGGDGGSGHDGGGGGGDQTDFGAFGSLGGQ